MATARLDHLGVMSKRPPLPSSLSAEALLLDEVWEQAFSFLDTDADRNSVSLVCKAWHRIERFSRRKIFVGNCYAISPTKAIRRFPALRSVWIKGKPHFADFNLVPHGWGAGAYEWVAALAESCPLLEELRFKRMVVTDECLEIISSSFRNFRVLVLTSCEGFSTSGLAAIAANCRNLRELDLQENDVDEWRGNWISSFPETFTSLVSLNLACLEGEVNFTILEHLVSRCTNLKTLKLNPTVPLKRLANILKSAPQLNDLGTGNFSGDPQSELYSKLKSAFSHCKGLKNLSGIWEACPVYLPTVYDVCRGLTTLNLSYATIRSPEFIKLVRQCTNLRKLWVLDFVEDDGLDAVASSCKFLQELRVFPSDLYGAVQPISLTERGLVAVSVGCPMLISVLYFCRQMTNAALTTVAQNRPNLIRFRLCIIDPQSVDYVTLQPLDAGFSAIVKSCKNLRRLSISGLLTDHVFESIGAHANCLEMLSVAFAGDSDLGLHYILSGCKSLRKLEIRDCPFGDKALLDNAAKLETMRSLWMSSCSVSLGMCRLLARKMPRLNVEVVNEMRLGPVDSYPDDYPVEKLYIYRTIAGPRSDAPYFVWTVA